MQEERRRGGRPRTRKLNPNDGVSISVYVSAAERDELFALAGSEGVSRYVRRAIVAQMAA